MHNRITAAVPHIHPADGFRSQIPRILCKRVRGVCENNGEPYVWFVAAFLQQQGAGVCQVSNRIFRDRKGESR